MPRWRLDVVSAALLVGMAVTSPAAQSRAVFRWAGDAEGGAPFVEADPSDPARVVGGDADIGLSGIEDTPARRATFAVTVPYYEFREVLSVRSTDAVRFATLADLAGRRVGTLGGTIAYEILLNAERELGIEAVSYDDDVHPYSDLVLGRLDAVLLDHVLAERRQQITPGFVTHPQPVAVGHYVGVMAPGNGALRDQVSSWTSPWRRSTRPAARNLAPFFSVSPLQGEPWW